MSTAAETPVAPLTTVYTDGACQGNPGPGGWAWAVPGGRWRAGAEARSTNQRMEIHAVLDAVTTLTGPLEVVSDSTYVVNCFRDRWWEGWLARGWTNSAKKPVANRDLWEPLIEAYRADPRRLRFRWVKGHSTDQMNDLVDRLAVQAAADQQLSEGDRPPTRLGPADRPLGGAASPADRPAGGAGKPAGHLVVVTGARPPELGGYGPNPVADRVRGQLSDILAAKATLHPDLVVLTGMGLGAEQLGAEAASAAGLPFVAVLPYPDPAAPWPPSSRARFEALMTGAADRIVLQREAPKTRQMAGGALNRRDAWLARHGDEAVVVWDGKDEALGRVVRSLQDHLGEEAVWVLEP